MNVKLIKLSYEYKDQLQEMIAEWKHDQEVNNTDHSPWAIFKNDPADFDYYLDNIEIKEYDGKFIPDKTFFCLDVDRNRLVGAANIRLFLNEHTYLMGGHIGDGIRPSERRKGYATAMVGLALEECRRLGMNKVLMTCSADNIGSEKSMINNGGIFESEVEEAGEHEKRYWFNLHEEIIESSRLSLRRLMPMDYQEMAAWSMDERVYEYLLNPPCEKPEDALNFLRRNDPNSTSRYIMIEHAKEDGHAVGVVSAVYDEEDDTWEISYNCNYNDWGKGYTTEGALALMDYVRKQHGPCRFKSECANDNIGSCKVIEKLGMKFLRDSSYTKRDGSVTFESKVYITE